MRRIRDIPLRTGGMVVITSERDTTIGCGHCMTCSPQVCGNTTLLVTALRHFSRRDHSSASLAQGATKVVRCGNPLCNRDPCHRDPYSGRSIALNLFFGLS